ncbi:MAG TPA: zinc ribbon domain-containing protein YjdM [Pseudobdellovibrionaceae bacterium]|mgnify:CR=1 FL=1|nr:zinc ribbon domain-containing protein YjdM [Pseudobdellovibrionaceae bacterium]
MTNENKCPLCNSEHTYQDGNLWICPECSHEWNPLAQSNKAESASLSTEDENIVRDSNGNILSDGDAVTVIKELKIKGATSSIKVGTKVKSIRLFDAGDGHNISCKIDGIGSINLKSEFVRKA